MFKNKTLLITGGTGSFGNAVLDRFSDTEIKEIRIFSRDEKKQNDIRVALNNDKIAFYLGDVRDRQSIVPAMIGVDYVFHAAALKQVPSCEFYPLEAVKTNVVGTENVLQVAIDAEVEKVVCLSTDKAVYPINAMGMSKAMMEKVALAKARQIENNSNSKICVTRYGNVMASRGSVIPHFLQQIDQNLPITITDPKMTRFMMTLDEAVELVLYAYANGENGDTFVQKSPASNVDALARAICKYRGLDNHPIKMIGTRHGEKLFETLCSSEEMLTAIDEGSYFRIPSDRRGLNYSKYFTSGNKKLEVSRDYNSHNTKQLTLIELVNLLKSIDLR